MSRFVSSVAVLALFSACGCSTVTVDVPIGEKVEPTQLIKFAGRWETQERESMEVRLTKDNQLVAGNLKWDEEAEKFTTDSGVLHIRQLGDFYYAFVEEQEGENKGRYHFARVEIVEGNKLRLMIPKASVYYDKIKKGQLEGTINTKEDRTSTFDIHVSATNDKIKEILSAKDSKEWFHEDAVLLLTRVQTFD